MPSGAGGTLLAVSTPHLPHDKEKAVHRPLLLATPIERGFDVEALQGSINKVYADLHIDREIAKDGEFGHKTFEAAKQTALALGICDEAQAKLEHHRVSESAQKLIRGREPTDAERIAARSRQDYREKLRKRYAQSAGAKAVAEGLKLVGVTEEPHGSNWGGKVQEFIEFTGYKGPVYWCGCLACWVVVKLGGARIPVRIRLGFAEYIVNDALAHTNGLEAVNIRNARAGDIGTLWGYEHVVVIREDVKPGDTMVKTLEGNTSSSGGSQSNGGEVATHERPIGDFDRGIAARPAWA